EWNAMRLKRAGLLAASGLCLGFVLSWGGLGWAQSSPAGSSGYHLVKSIPVGGDGLWDYCIVDAGARRLYVSHTDRVVVLNADTDAIVGEIPDTTGVHGIALAADLGRGFTSDGQANSITIFNLKSLGTIATVASGGKNPDSIFYDAATKRVITFNGKSGSATAINARDGKVLGTFDVGGKPEFAAGAGDGRVFVNIEDKSQILQIDMRKLAILNRWSIAPCEEPSGLAMDKKNRRLFSVCHNNVMAVVDADNGKVVATPAIGDGPDAAGFDPATRLAFSSNGGSGTITVVHEDSPDQYRVIENVPTQKYARTMAVDYRTHNIFLPTGVFEGAIPPGAKRPPMKPGSFGVLLVSKK
ncbi:MAG: YncE family protein, partial [Candidatus Acidiferrales bacterium]